MKTSQLQDTQPLVPGLFAVSISFVEACINAGKLLKPLFCDGGISMPIHLHVSIEDPILRASLYDEIMVSHSLTQN